MKKLEKVIIAILFVAVGGLFFLYSLKSNEVNSLKEKALEKDTVIIHVSDTLIKNKILTIKEVEVETINKNINDTIYQEVIYWRDYKFNFDDLYLEITADTIKKLNYRVLKTKNIEKSNFLSIGTSTDFDRLFLDINIGKKPVYINIGYDILNKKPKLGVGIYFVF